MRSAIPQAGLLFLTACIDASGCDCIEQVPDANVEAALGIPASAILLQGSKRQADGHWQEYMQLDMAEVPDAALKALPDKLCASDDVAAASWRLIEPTAEHINKPGSKVLVAECALGPGA